MAWNLQESEQTEPGSTRMRSAAISGSQQGMVDPISIIPLDVRSLSAFYTTGASLGPTLHAEVLRQGVLKDLINQAEVGVLPPWELPPPEPDGELLDRIFSGQPLIDLGDPLFARDDVDDAFKNLFSLYKGLLRVKELTEFAITSDADTLRTILDRQFQTLVGEATDYVEALDFEDITLVSGIKADTLTSTVDLPSTKLSVVHFGAVITDDRTAALPDLTGTEQFTFAVTNSSQTTTNVVVDLANVSGTLNIDNIVDEINTQLTAAAVGTSVSTQRDSEFAYRIRVDVGSGETLSLSADAATESAAVYVSGSFGSGTLGGGFALKLDDLGAADPNEVFRTSINVTDSNERAFGTAVDSDGNVYVVGSTGGNLDGQLNNDSDDVYLIKYDAAGEEVYTRMLGSASNSAGFSVAVDSLDNVVIAGQASGLLSESSFGGGYDAFVTKFDSDGQELFTRQAAPFADDGAFDLTIDSSNNIYLAGFARGSVGGETFGGSSDAFVTKLDSDGTLVYNEQFGDADGEFATAITVDNAGNVYVAGTDDGGAEFLRKYDDSGGSPSLTYNASLGLLGVTGDVTGIALDSNGDIFVSGHTTNTALASTVNVAHSGGLDAFILKVLDSDQSLDNVTYIGTSADDFGSGLAIDTSTDELYIAGSTEGTFAGETQKAATDGFVAKVDSAGAIDFTHQFGGNFEHRATDIAFDAVGTDVLTRLGLGNGETPGDSAETVIAVTTARPDQFFSIAINGDSAEKITIEDDDSLGFLVFKINSILGTKGRASIEDDLGVKKLQIKALDGNEIEVLAGADGFDALGGLGLKPARLFGEPADENDVESATVSAFALGIIDGLSVLDKTEATNADTIIDNALREIRDAFRFITEGPEPEFEDPGSASALILAQIASLQDALARIQAFNAPTLSGNSSLFNLVI